MAKNFHSCTFLKAAYTAAEIDKTNYRYPEIVIVGRSNVGKSSLLNFLFGSRYLAKVSSKPGKTQSVNYYLIDNRTLLVDLPGYGYAKTAKQTKTEFSNLIEHYLATEPVNSRLFLLLLDLRREHPSEEDIQMAKWIAASNALCMILFTKADKIAPSKQDHQMTMILKELSYASNLQPASVGLCSIMQQKTKVVVLAKLRDFLNESKD